MSMIDEVRTQMMAAMKEKNKERKDALSMLLSALKNKAIDKRADLTEDEENAVVLREIKQCQESIEQATGREDIIAENTLRICHYANVNFTGFFVGKIIDSAIIGVITFVAMAILRLDFALLISVFIGITNIIPVFGPFIGAIPSIFILLLVDPIQAVIFGVLILVIQQVDGNFIGPKILGSSIGISALWILFSIVVGGDLFGLVGMVVGVPLFATFYGLAREFVHYMLDKRGLDSEGNHVGEVVEDEENVFE